MVTSSLGGRKNPVLETARTAGSPPTADRPALSVVSLFKHKPYLLSQKVIPSRIMRRRENSTKLHTSSKESAPLNTVGSKSPQRCSVTDVIQERPTDQRCLPIHKHDPKIILELFSRVRSLAQKMHSIHTYVSTVEAAINTSNRVEEALTRRLAGAQALEALHTSLLEATRNKSAEMKEAQETLRKESSSLSREIMRINNLTWNAKEETMKGNDLLKQSQDKRGEAMRVLPLLRTSSTKAVEDIRSLEACLQNEMLTQTRTETLMHIVARDIRWISRLKDRRGPVNQSIRVALIAPDEYLTAPKNDSLPGPLGSKQEPLEKKRIFKIAYRINRSSPTVGSASSQDPNAQEDALTPHLVLPVTGAPTCWVSMTRSTNNDLLSEKESSTLTQYHDSSVVVPFDKIIEYDPSKRPHELLVTDWENVHVPDPEQITSTVNQPMCCCPDMFEHQQIEAMVSTLVSEFLDPILDNGSTKPLVAGILSIGSRDSSHCDTFWGNPHPQCVTQKPILDKVCSDGAEFHTCATQLRGIVEIMSRCVFEARDKWNDCFSKRDHSQPSSFKVEACFETVLSAECHESNDLASTVTSTHDTLNNMDASVGDKDLRLSETSLELLRSLESHKDVPGMGLHREHRQSLSASMSTENVIDMFLNMPPRSVPRLHLPNNRSPIDDGDACFTSATRLLNSARDMTSHCVTEPFSTRSATAVFESSPTEPDLQFLRDSLAPSFTHYHTMCELLDDYHRHCGSTDHIHNVTHQAVVFRVTCSVQNSLHGGMEQVTLTLVVCGLTLTSTLDTTNLPGDSKIPCFGDVTLDDVFLELCYFPKGVTLPSTSTGTARRKRRANTGWLNTEGNEDECRELPLGKGAFHMLTLPLPKTPIGRLFRYLSLTIFSQQVKKNSERLSTTSQEDPNINYSGGCLIVLCHLLIPYVESSLQFLLLEAIRRVMTFRSDVET